MAAFGDELQQNDPDGLHIEDHDQNSNMHECIAEAISWTKSGTLLHEVSSIVLSHYVPDMCR